MKLASYADGSRDGHLVIVSRDLTQAHFATGIATRLQQVLDDWGFVAPQLDDLATQLNHGRLRHAFPFEPARCTAPLPRAAGWAMVAEDESVRWAPGVFAGPTAPVLALPAAHPHLALISGDLAARSDAASACDALRLVSFAVDWRVDEGSLATQFAPVAVTPDELGGALRVDARLVALHNGQKLEPRDVRCVPGAALARVARWRALQAGQVVGMALGALDLVLAPGDSLRLDLKSADGASLFGAIDIDIGRLE
jgi:fumarylacetoacetate (FAA) hydrolase